MTKKLSLLLCLLLLSNVAHATTSTIPNPFPTTNMALTSANFAVGFTAARNDINALWASQTGGLSTGTVFAGTGDCTISGNYNSLVSVCTKFNGTSFGTMAAQNFTSVNITGGTIAATFTGALTGNASTATALQTGRTINGVTFDGTSNITVPAAAGTLTGSTLASGVTASSLTSFGASPTLVTPNIGAATGTSLALSGNVTTTSGVVGIGTATPTTGVSLDLGSKNNSILLPVGTTGQRPTGVAGMLRYNSTLAVLEGYIGSAWVSVATKPSVQVFTGSGDVTMTTDVLEVNKGTPATTIVTLPASPVTGEEHTIKDGAGNAGTYTITVSATPKLIDDATTKPLYTNWQSLTVYYNGSAWRIK